MFAQMGLYYSLHALDCLIDISGRGDSIAEYYTILTGVREACRQVDLARSHYNVLARVFTVNDPKHVQLRNVVDTLYVVAKHLEDVNDKWLLADSHDVSGLCDALHPLIRQCHEHLYTAMSEWGWSKGTSTCAFVSDSGYLYRSFDSLETTTNVMEVCGIYNGVEREALEDIIRIKHLECASYPIRDLISAFNAPMYSLPMITAADWSGGRDFVCGLLIANWEGQAKSLQKLHELLSG